MVPSMKGLILLVCSLHLAGGALLCNEAVKGLSCYQSGPFHTFEPLPRHLCLTECEAYATVNGGGCCLWNSGDASNKRVCGFRQGDWIRGDDQEDYYAARCFKRLNCYRNTGVNGHNDHVFGFATLKECKMKCVEMGGDCGSMEFHSSGTGKLKQCNIASSTRDVTGWSGPGKDQGWTYCDALKAGLNCYPNTGVAGHNDYVYYFATLKECKAKCLEFGGDCGSMEFHSSGTGQLKQCNIASFRRDYTGWSGPGNDQGWTYCDALEAAKPDESCGVLEKGKQCSAGFSFELSQHGDAGSCSAMCAQHIGANGGHGCCQYAAAGVGSRCRFYRKSSAQKAANESNLYAATCQDLSVEARERQPQTAQEAESLSSFWKSVTTDILYSILDSILEV